MIAPALALFAAWPAGVAAAPAGTKAETTAPRGARADGNLRTSIGAEFDSNALRRIEASADAETPADGLLRVVLDGYGTLRLARGWQIRGQLLTGAKRFFDLSSEDQWAQFTSADVSKRWGRLSLGLYGGFRITRTRRGVRDYAYEQARLRGELDLGRDWTAGLWGGLAAYQFEPEPRFSYVAPGGSAFLSKTFSEDLQLTTWVEGLGVLYDGPILVVGGEDPFCDPGDRPECPDRRDRVVRVGGRIRYAGPILLVGAAYQVSLQESNSEETDVEVDGGTERVALEDVTRHRISAFLTVPLVWKVLLSAQGAIQVNDGTSLTDELQLGDEDENRTSLQVQLRRPVFGPVSVEVRYAFYTNLIGGGVDFDYARHTVFGGLSVSAEGTRIEGGSRER
jgi:hypothetical protein